jgi:hypothetical protein
MKWLHTLQAVTPSGCMLLKSRAESGGGVWAESGFLWWYDQLSQIISTPAIVMGSPISRCLEHGVCCVAHCGMAENIADRRVLY